MSAQAVKSGEAYIVISAKLDQLRADLKKGQSELKGWGSTLSGIFAGLSIAGVGAAISGVMHSFADAGSQINDMAARTGLATGQLQELKFAAGQTGASLDDIEKAARHFVKEGGNVRNFEAMGQAIANIADPSDRARAAIDAFGKSGTKLLPMFAEFKALKQSSAAVGPILTAAEVEAGDRLGDAMSAMNEALHRAGQHLASALAPALIEVLETCIGITAQVHEWANAKKGPLTSFSLGVAKAAVAPLVITGANERGEQALAGLTEISKAAARKQAAAAEESQTAKLIDSAAKANADMWRVIQRGIESRNSIIREFENPAERFIRRQQEINNALAQLNRNRVMGFMDAASAAAQRAGLEEAMRRLGAEERKRVAGLFKSPSVVAEEVRETLRSSKGTFSAAGASMLGRAGESALERKVETTNKHLGDIKGEIRKLAPPKFS